MCIRDRIYRVVADIVGREYREHEICLTPGREKRFFASAITAGGTVHYLPSLLGEMERIYLVDVPVGYANSGFMSVLREGAIYRGLDVETFYCPLCPDEKIDHCLLYTSTDEGTDRMKEIAGYIREGAMAFLAREYKTMVIVVVVLFLIIGFALQSWTTAVLYLCGAALSVLAGFFGMKVATLGNVRTANAARESGMNKALKIAFRSGAVMGL